MSTDPLCVHCSDPLNDKGEDVFTGSTFCGANPVHDRHESEKETETMSETTTTTDETPIAEKTFGLGAEAYARYIAATEAAETARSLAVKGAAEPLTRVQQALYDAFPNRRGEARSLFDLITKMTQADTNARDKAIDDAYSAAIDAAQEALDEAVKDDPFALFVASHIRTNYGDSYAEKFFEAMPLTYDGLKALARENGWCTDFERVMLRAVEQGALPDDRVEVTMPIHWTDVPSRFEPDHTDVWRATLLLPPFIRLTDTNGVERDVVTLRYYVGDPDTYVRYEKVLPEGESADDSAKSDIG